MTSERGEWVVGLDGTIFEDRGIPKVGVFRDELVDIAILAWNQARRINPQNPEAVIGQIEEAFTMILDLANPGILPTKSDKRTALNIWQAAMKGTTDGN